MDPQKAITITSLTVLQYYLLFACTLPIIFPFALYLTLFKLPYLHVLPLSWQTLFDASNGEVSAKLCIMFTGSLKLLSIRSRKIAL